MRRVHRPNIRHWAMNDAREKLERQVSGGQPPGELQLIEYVEDIQELVSWRRHVVWMRIQCPRLGANRRHYPKIILIYLYG